MVKIRKEIPDHDGATPSLFSIFYYHNAFCNTATSAGKTQFRWSVGQDEVLLKNVASL